MQATHSLPARRPLPKPPVVLPHQTESARDALVSRAQSSSFHPHLPAEKLAQLAPSSAYPDSLLNVPFYPSYSHASVSPQIVHHIMHFCGQNLTFDLACLDGLDDQLLYRPLDSYSDLCWAEATGTIGYTRTATSDDSNTIVFTVGSDSFSSNSLTPTQSLFWADDEEDDVDGQTSDTASPITPMSPETESPCPPYSPPHPALSYRLSVNIGELQTPLMTEGLVESLFVKMHVCDPTEAIQFFPAGSARPKSVNRGQRFATFCGRLARSGSDDSST